MSTPLRVLLVEDNPDDAELLLRQLIRAGFDVSSERVEDEDGLAEALDDGEWDLVLADYSLPGFSGLDALHMITGRELDVPLVLVSGMIDVPTALEAMKAGAKDFVLKDDTAKLPSVIERELAESADRARRRRAEAERDKALEELRDANEQLSAFVNLTDLPLRGMTAPELLEALLTRLIGIVGADGACVALAKEGGLTTAAVVGKCIHPVDGPLGDEFSGRVFSGDASVYVRDLGVDCEPDGSDGPAPVVRSAIGVPMHHGGQVTGVLQMGWSSVFEPPTWFPPLLEMAADRVALALENARLYEHEHRIAETLQQALLSVSTGLPGLEVGHFYGSATTETLVGGDFYDLFETVPGTVAFSIGDVSGKGLEAASVTALVKNTMRAHAVDGDPPDVVVGKSNDVVARFTTAATFVTGLFGTLDTVTGELCYCTAGHPAPAVVGPRGVRELGLGGPVLGVFPEAEYESARTTLAPEESVVLFTDGLTEARSPGGEFYGEERLLAFLDTLAGEGPTQIATLICDEIWAFCGGKLRDDAAVLVLRLAEDVTADKDLDR